MKAVALIRRLVVLAEDISQPVSPSRHGFKYRLACGGQNNERGKGDHGMYEVIVY